MCPKDRYQDALGQTSCRSCHSGEIPNNQSTSCTSPPWGFCNVGEEFLNNTGEQNDWHCDKCVSGVERLLFDSMFMYLQLYSDIHLFFCPSLAPFLLELCTANWWRLFCWIFSCYFESIKTQIWMVENPQERTSWSWSNFCGMYLSACLSWCPQP